MASADSPGPGARQQSFSLVIVGGGIMGLWAGVMAERAGIDTLLVTGRDAERAASRGLLGALMPHMPDNWSDKKQFQFEALLALEAEAQALEAETGVKVGYRRSGRLIPLPKPHLRVIAERHQMNAETVWSYGERRFSWQVCEPGRGEGWPDDAFTGAGLVHDTLAARISPRGLMAALGAKLEAARHVRVLDGVDVAAVDPGGVARLDDGTDVAFGHIMIANGYRAFDLLAALPAPAGRTLSPASLGQPVKGQAALLKADVAPDLPLIFLDGVYIVPHDGGLVAVGSTSEASFSNPFDTDDQLEALIGKARALAPMLLGAEVIERWAGLRPKAVERDPMVGPHPEHPRVLALTGGFKVSFGLAHRLAEAAIGFIAGSGPAVPEGFLTAHHFAAVINKR